MNVMALFAGIGGMQLGLRLANPASRVVCYVEREAYVASILVRRMAEKALDEAPIWSDVDTFDGRPWRGKVDCITAGLPCQPFSSAGKRRGRSDERWLWPTVRRIVREVEPSQVFLENVPDLLRMGFGEIQDDLQGLGFRVTAGLFSAQEVGAPHERDRLFVLAHAHRRQRTNGAAKSLAPTSGRATKVPFAADDSGSTVGQPFPPGPRGDWHGVRPWPVVESDVFGMADGTAGRVDRFKGIGNSVVPVVAALAYRTLAQALGP
jgi:DNA (cytosine-5)-methyltransferase 1